MTDATTRKLSLFDATMLVMGGILGIGIFFTPPKIAREVTEPGAYLAMWGLGALAAVPIMASDQFINDGSVLCFAYGCDAWHGLSSQSGVVGTQLIGKIESFGCLGDDVREGPKG